MKKKKISKNIKSCIIISTTITAISALLFTNDPANDYFDGNIFIGILLILLSILSGFVTGIIPGMFFGALYGSMNFDDMKLSKLQSLSIILSFSGFSVFCYYFASQELSYGILEYLGFIFGTTYTFIFVYARRD